MADLNVAAAARRGLPNTINGRVAGPVGYGLLGLTIPWALVETAHAVRLLRTALEGGANVWNGSTHYGTPDANTLHLLKQYFTLYPNDAERVILTMKGAFSISSGPTGSPAAVRASVEEAVRVLAGTKKIDVFALGRVDPKVPIEESVSTLASLVEEGLIGGVGLSEVSASTIRRASKVCRVACVEMEMSLFTTTILGDGGVWETCRELEIPIIAYSPTARGWLSGQIRSLDDLPANDFRRRLPRFQPSAFEHNLRLVRAVEDFARRKNATPAQVALAWMIAHGAIPIPGSTSLDRVVENCRAGGVQLSQGELDEVNGILQQFAVVGERYGGEAEKLLNG